MPKIRVEQKTIVFVNNAFNSITLPDDQNIPFVFKSVLNFQGKKSPILASKLISKLTTKDDIIYDPFFGSGSFILASSLANRKIIGTELDNYTFGSLKMLLTKIDFKVLYNNLSLISKAARDKIMNLYETKCCNQKNYISKLHFDPITQEYFNPKPHRDIHNGNNIKLVNKCPICGKKEKAQYYNTWGFVV